MSETPQTPSEDRTFRASLTRHVAAAGVLVVCVAAAFWAVGAFGGDDDPVPVVADAPDVEPDEGARPPDDEPSDLGALGEPADDGAEDDAELEGAEEDADALDDLVEPDADDGEGDDAAPDADEDGADGADNTDDTDADEPPPATIDPATITVQVLDGFQGDGGTAADAVADRLEERGYDVVAQNPALRYEVTTVLWSPGFEDEGHQVAREIGAAEAREQPGNLSTSVAVHVVVGADRG